MRGRLLLHVYITAVVVWGLLSYAKLFDYLSHNVLFAREFGSPPRVYISDFVSHYAAAELARQSLTHKINIYDPKLQDDAERKLVAPMVPEKVFYLQYPPQHFLLVMPLSLLPLPASWLVWVAIWLTASIFAMLSLCRDALRQYKIWLVIIALASEPWWLSTQLGQTALVFFPLTVFFFRLLEQRRYMAAGVVAGFSAIKLQYLPALGITGLLAGGLPFAVSAALTLGGLLGATALFLGFDNVMRFPQALVTGETTSAYSGVSADVMQNFRGELWLLLRGEGHASHVAASAVALLAVLALGYVWWRYYARPKWRSPAVPPDTWVFRWLVSISVLVMITTSVHTHTQDYVLATIPCIWFWLAPDTSSGLRRLILAIPGLSWLMFVLRGLFSGLFIQPFFAWGVCMLVAIVNEKRKHATGAGNNQ